MKKWSNFGMLFVGAVYGLIGAFNLIFEPSQPMVNCLNPSATLIVVGLVIMTLSSISHSVDDIKKQLRLEADLRRAELDSRIASTKKQLAESEKRLAESEKRLAEMKGESKEK